MLNRGLSNQGSQFQTGMTIRGVTRNTWLLRLSSLDATGEISMGFILDLRMDFSAADDDFNVIAT